MNSASTQTSMSFMPIDRDVIVDCRLDCEIERSFILHFSLLRVAFSAYLLCIAKLMLKKRVTPVLVSSRVLR